MNGLVAAQLDPDRRAWYEMLRLIGTLTPEERLIPGYYRDPEWSVRDLVAHLGTWLAEAQAQFERIGAGTYEGHEVDVALLNATFLTAMADQPWGVVWIQAHAARSRMLDEWYALLEPDAEAAWWLGKGGGRHVAEHLERLEEWVDQLVARR